ncbi:tumor suppressor p53-binding protein 1-like [Notothenia coriiceps]|uniref:Tumor suppressor p53-binding protein 1-like n=1 Tax=Notothenia coriiceps TaxID=8208 RepID=A0A6I9NC43_9TELE|nr:PREDICTED: tumor suppressor p53-binding protein 1-like [Notothenia coriiceps]
MDTSLPPEDRAEPMETEAASKPHPSASTPVSQNSPGFVLERTLSLPSQPEFSHDVFVPTQSQSQQQSDKKKASLPRQTQSQPLESAPFTLPLQLSVNTQISSQAQKTSEPIEEDSQATQIEELKEPPGDSDSQQRRESNGMSSQSQTATSSKASPSAESPKHRAACQLQKSEVHKKTATSLNVQNVNVKDSKSDVVSCSQPKVDLSDVTVNSCVQETPPAADPTPCSLPSHSMISQTVDVVKGSVDSRKAGAKANSQSLKSLSQQSVAAGNSQTVKDVMGESNKWEEEEEVMEGEGESTLGGGASGLGLALSQSQLLSPEPMEEESENRGEDSITVVTDSERDSQPLQAKTNSSQPTRGKVSCSTNGHESQTQGRKLHPAPDRLSQTGAGLEAEGHKDKSLSDSSGEMSFHFTLPKEGELIGPVVGATPPLIGQLKQTLRHSTPIEITSFSQKSGAVGDVSADGAMAASDIVSGESGDDTMEKGDGKLSLRMKLVTPVEEGSSERFSLQKPALSEEDGPVVKVTTVAKAVTSPSVFSRVRQVHRQQDAREESQGGGNSTPVR